MNLIRVYLRWFFPPTQKNKYLIQIPISDAPPAAR